jgi:ribonuclease P protein component
MGIGNTFKKSERLSLKNRVGVLFATGTAINIYPLKVVWLSFTEPLEYPAQVLFTVSRKRFKRAFDRNRIKRKMKEAFRLQKSFLYEELIKKDKKLLIGIVYTGNDPEPHSEILNNKLKQAFDVLLPSCDNT